MKTYVSFKLDKRWIRMSKVQTDKCRYKSRFSTEELWISDSQYLAENMVSRIARKDKEELPLLFWTVDKWKRHFMLQLRLANSLLKLYSVEAIIKALRTNVGAKIYSFQAKWLDPLIKIEQEKINIQKKKQEEKSLEENYKKASEDVVIQEDEVPVFFNPQGFQWTKLNTLDKLREINNG